MDDPLTKWLHLHSNINNTAGTVSPPQNTSLHLNQRIFRSVRGNLSAFVLVLLL